VPLYEYRCAEHGKFDGWARMDERHEPQACPCCGTPSAYTISAPRVFSDFEPYESPASGKWISGRRERAEDFARTNTRPYEIGEMKDAQARAKLAEAKADAEVDAAVETTLTEILN
jgi:putative FmdB family regulatory protein